MRNEWKVVWWERVCWKKEVEEGGGKVVILFSHRIGLVKCPSLIRPDFFFRPGQVPKVGNQKVQFPSRGTNTGGGLYLG